MSAHFGSHNISSSVRVADRQHVHPVLEGILYSTDRKAHVAVLHNEASRRRSSSASSSSASPSSASSSASSSTYLSPAAAAASRKAPTAVVSPDVIALASVSDEKRRSKSSLFCMGAFGKNRASVGITNIM